MKILFGYSYFESKAYPDIEKFNLECLEEVRQGGIDVEGFCLTLNPPGPCLRFRDLDRMWKRGDRTLMEMYERLEKKLEDVDVLINGSGINLHPRFVEQLPVFTVFQCFDDPENSRNLSRPAASAYDLSLVGNIAEVESYRSWGVKRAEWTPHGLMPGSYDPTLTEEQVLEGRRDIDLFMLIDRMSKPRRAQMEAMASAFPDAHFYGKGWPRGFFPWEDQVDYLLRTQIGPNFHNSSGPINFRTYYLPACGVLQFCDNKSHLGKIFELDREVIGFDTVEECIELSRYYLAHPREAREIAAAGWRRAMKDYTAQAVFAQKVRAIRKAMDELKQPKENGCIDIAIHQREATRGRRIVYDATKPIRKTLQVVKNGERAVRQHFKRSA